MDEQAVVEHPGEEALEARPPIVPAGPCVMVVFGAGGDLTRRKLVPALINLRRGGLLKDDTRVVAMTRPGTEEMGFRAKLLDDVSKFVEPALSAEERGWLDTHLSVVFGDLDQPATYDALRGELDRLGLGHALFYLAVPPTLFGPIAKGLGAAGLVQGTVGGSSEPAWRRIVVEKPFGHDVASARALNQELRSAFPEPQIYRIDHYLGKETVQNLMVFRFANGMFEPVWNRRYIDHVQITAAETVGVERRAAYYEGAGALRDMVQNHLMQLLSLVAMEPPIAFSAENVRDRKMDALMSAQPLVNNGTTDVVRAQYGEGWVAGGEVPAYRQEPGVNPQSTTETFVALRMQLDSWRWAGVPFYLRTGKRMPKRTTEIAIQLRRPPLEIFRRVSSSSVAPNLLIVNVQPDEGISVRFEAKLPGTRMQLAPVMMNFRYGTAFGGSVPEAYETLLLDAMVGDPTLFARHDFVERSWELITPVHEQWAKEQAPAIPTYESGEWGPAEADQLMARDGHRWRTL